MDRIKKQNYYFTVFSIMSWIIIPLFYATKPVFAEGNNLLLAPIRVILEGKERSTTVKLINTNNQTDSYRIEIVSTRMNEHGKITQVESPTERELLAQKMIRFSPRRVTLPPKGWQTIRLMARKPKDLPPGEYRTQLRVSPIKFNKQPQIKEKPQQGVSIDIDIAFALSIPIIVRHGEGAVNIIPHAPKLITKNKKHFLETNIERTGLFSSYFDVYAFFIPRDKTERIEIGSNKGLAIYAENKNHIVQVPIKTKDALANGKIQIEIRDREKPGSALISSKTFE